ncbi:MAG: arginase [Pseudomonadota bacterium]|nr:arginase [Pseudomonadota bacterium]
MKSDNRATAMKVIGAASGLGAPDKRCGRGPAAIWKAGQQQALTGVEWGAIVEPPATAVGEGVEGITDFCADLAATVAAATAPGRRLAVVSGDHSCAIGTWNGVARGLDGPLGLIWIDAHMDAHTPYSTPSGRWHGMPVATLLGHGAPTLLELAPQGYVVQPQHLVMVGVRSYEPPEKALLQELGVKFFTDDDVDRIGFANVMRQAQQIVSSGTAAYGISIDLDGLATYDAPGVGSPVVGGIPAKQLLTALALLARDPKLVAMEIAEFNPAIDVEHRTQQLVLALLATLSDNGAAL